MNTTLTRCTRAVALALSAALLSSCALAIDTVKPADGRLQYTGRIDFANPAAPKLSWPGTSIGGRFTGTRLALVLDDQHGRNWFNVFIDGELTKPVILDLDKGSKTYLVAENLAPGEHSFLLTKRTEGEEGETVFKGLELADGGQLLAPPPRPKRRIEFFGDSITSGMGNESPDDGPDHLERDKNNFNAFSAMTARGLNAEAHVISQSGIGVMVSWFPFTMPQFYDQLSAVGDNDSRWDFASWTPDVVVINLMQNDKWLIDREKRLSPAPTEAQRIAAYQGFVAEIRRMYPKAYIVCALGSMDATAPGSKWPGYMKAAVQALRKKGDKRIDTLVFPYTGFDPHPRVRDHQANAERLIKFIKKKMKW